MLYFRKWLNQLGLQSFHVACRSFKRARCFVLTQAILFWASGSVARTHIETFDLAISLVYLLNRMVSSPVEMKAEVDIRMLLTKGSMETHPLPDGDWNRKNRYGILFPHNVIGGSKEIDAPHFGPGFQLRRDTYNRLFNMDQQMARMSVNRRAQPANRPPVPTQPTNRGHRVPSVRILPYNGTISEGDWVKLDPRRITFCSDLGVAHDDHSSEVTTLNKSMTNILARFYMDLCLCIPKRRSQVPHTKLSDSQCNTATANTFQHLNLSKCWNVITIRDDISMVIWSTNLKRLFPLSNNRAAKVEQKPCGYFTLWCNIVGSLDEDSVLYIFETVIEVSGEWPNSQAGIDP